MKAFNYLALSPGENSGIEKFKIERLGIPEPSERYNRWLDLSYDGTRKTLSEHKP